MGTFKLMSDAEVEGMHQAVLRILAEVGVVLAHAGARRMLTDAGAKVRDQRVLIPSDVVERCIAACPSQVYVRGRGGTIKTLGDGSLNFHNLGGARDIYDPVTGEHRLAVLQDVRDATRLLDALPNCNTITPFFTRPR